MEINCVHARESGIDAVRCRIGRFGGHPSHFLCANVCRERVPLFDGPAGSDVVKVFRVHMAREIDRLSREGAGITGAGRGVVIVGGGAYFPGAYVLVRLLRHLGSQLPVELWYLPGECGEAERAIMEPLNVRLVDPTPFGPFRIMKGWQLKPLAALRSSFAEVICLDSDSYPARDPAFLFDSLPYLDCGAIFWPDRFPDSDLVPATWVALGMPPRSEPDFESGQFVVDRRRCGHELALTHWMNQHSDYYYRVAGEPTDTTWRVWGDKSTFHLAWRRLGTGYAMPPIRPNWLEETIYQRDFQGNVLFQHRCRDKFTLCSTDKSGRRFFPATPQTQAIGNQRKSGWIHEGFCHAAIEDLRAIYDPARCSTPVEASF